MWKLRNKFIIRTLAKVGAFAARLWFRTMRNTIYTERDHICPYTETGDERHLYCLWHDEILGVIFSGPCLNVSGLVSHHADGSWVADMMNAVGLRAIRGSSSRGGAAALREMIRDAEGWHICIATDGPRGPRHEVKTGLIYLASQTGRGIVPTAFVGENTWKPKGKWTDLVVPKPFSRTHLAGSAPMYVPPGLSKSELEPYRLKLQRQMDQLHDRLERLAQGETVDLFAPAEGDATDNMVESATDVSQQRAA
ncbi:MAG: lysophospholipid acyltransferase family protein [Planctomycetaceae bacterium]